MNCELDSRAASKMYALASNIFPLICIEGVLQKKNKIKIIQMTKNRFNEKGT
jgi:hypothetical protein